MAKLWFVILVSLFLVGCASPSDIQRLDAQIQELADSKEKPSGKKLKELKEFVISEDNGIEHRRDRMVGPVYEYDRDETIDERLRRVEQVLGL